MPRGEHLRGMGEKEVEDETESISMFGYDTYLSMSLPSYEYYLQIF